jgi:glycosyltransferase involved in cell wall biosynthesis
MGALRAGPHSEPAREGLLKKNRRGECTSARYEVARSDRHSCPAVQQADPRRAVVEYASLDADDVVGAIRLNGEARIGEDRGVRDGRDVTSGRHVNTAGIKEDVRVIDECVPAGRAARHIDAVLREMPDRAADDIELFAGGKAHAINARPEPLDVEPFENDPVSRPGGDNDAVRSRHQNAGFDVIGAKLSRNYGHQLALTAGLSVVRGDFVFIIDDDLQDPPELLAPMLELMRTTSADVVYGQTSSRPSNIRDEPGGQQWKKCGEKLTEHLSNSKHPPWSQATPAQDY